VLLSPKDSGQSSIVSPFVTSVSNRAKRCVGKRGHLRDEADFHIRPLVEPDRRVYDGAPGTSDFEWWPDGLLDQEPPPQGFVARLRAQSDIDHTRICKDKDKPDLGCPKHGVQIIRLSENSIFDFAVLGDWPPPHYQE
jgi:hypothetical protein